MLWQLTSSQKFRLPSPLSSSHGIPYYSSLIFFFLRPVSRNVMHRATAWSSDSSPFLSFSLYPFFSLKYALLRNNEGIYFINTGYPPRGIVLSSGEGNWEKTSDVEEGESEGWRGRAMAAVTNVPLHGLPACLSWAALMDRSRVSTFWPPAQR